MKFVSDNWLVIIVALTSGGMLAWPLLRSGRAGSITAAQAVQLMNREKAVVVDVSDAAEFAAGHIAGSRNIPLAGLESAKNLPTNKTLPIVLVCASGTRSSRAAATLSRLGHERVHVLGGGLKAWRDASLPVERAAEPAEKADNKASKGPKSGGKAADKTADKAAEKAAEKPAEKSA